MNAANPGYTATDLNRPQRVPFGRRGSGASVHLATLDAHSDAHGPSGILRGHPWTAGGRATPTARSLVSVGPTDGVKGPLPSIDGGKGPFTSRVTMPYGGEGLLTPQRASHAAALRLRIVISAGTLIRSGFR